MADLALQNLPITSPIQAAGLLDTGSTVTGIARQVLNRLGLTALTKSSTQTAGGSRPVELFEVSLTIHPASGQSGPVLVRDRLVVMALPQPLDGVEVLIGLDVLSQCVLIADGPGKQFTLLFS
jgi:hypothetical protein